MRDTTVLAPSFPTTTPTSGRFLTYIRKPGDLVGAVHVPDKDAERLVRAHALMHRSVLRLAAPRFALWQGAPGSGKSQLVANALLTMGTAVLIAPPSIFGTRYEGGAVETFTELMNEASNWSAAHRLPIAVLLEDVDASLLAVKENTGHTTATREATGHLQFLADHRDVHVDHQGHCIPIYATANAAGDGIRESLFRDMRASVHTHQVSGATKSRIAYQLFKPVGATECAIINRLLKAFADESLAFWPALHYDLSVHLIGSACEAANIDMATINRALTTRPPLDEALLHRLADKHRKNRPGIFWGRKKRRWPFGR